MTDLRSVSVHDTTTPLLLAAVLLLPVSGCDLVGGSDKDEESSASSVPESVAFIQNHPSAAALYATRGDTVVATYHADRRQPLASTVKYAVALEYARQAAAGTIRPDSLVPLDHFQRFAGLTGSTSQQLHRDWIAQARSEGRVQNEQVSLRTVARGMMEFSSNPATEYLMHLLTLDAINDGLDALGLEQHDRVHYLVSDLYVGVEEGLQGEERAQFMRSLSTDERASRAAQIHRTLAQDEGGSYRDSLETPGFAVQRAWSDHLPAATAREYAQFMQRINDRTLPEGTQEELSAVLRATVESPRFSHAGLKGGSTPWILTRAGFFTGAEDGTQTELVLLFDGTRQAQARMADLDEEILNGLLEDPSYRRALARTLGE
jgi:D-alanyl-D-alanine carboxypeptidase